MKKYDYFVPCYYDFKKERVNGVEEVVLDTSKHYNE
jgi:hypothetical protein